MKLLKKRRSEAPPDQAETPPVCEHITLIPSWDRAEDIGHENRVARYRCESCAQEFTLAEADHLRETEAARLRRMMAS